MYINAQEYTGDLDAEDLRLLRSPWLFMQWFILLHTLYNDCQNFIKNKQSFSPLYNKAFNKDKEQDTNDAMAVLGYSALPLYESAASAMLGIMLEYSKIGKAIPSVIEYPFFESFIFLKNISHHSGNLFRNDKDSPQYFVGGVFGIGYDIAELIANYCDFFNNKKSKIAKYRDMIYLRDKSNPYHKKSSSQADLQVQSNIP